MVGGELEVEWEGEAPRGDVVVVKKCVGDDGEREEEECGECEEEGADVNARGERAGEDTDGCECYVEEVFGEGAVVVVDELLVGHYEGIIGQYRVGVVVWSGWS